MKKMALAIGLPIALVLAYLGLWPVEVAPFSRTLSN